MSTDNTGTTGGSKAGIGSKIRGAAEVVHGVGDNVRGTFLGAIDTATGRQSENDEIAARGRMEVSQGMAKIRGAGAGATAGYESGGGFGPGTGTGTMGGGGGYGNKTADVGTQQSQSPYQREPSGYQGDQRAGAYQQDQPGREYAKDQSGNAYQQGYGSRVDQKQEPLGYQESQQGSQQDQPGEYVKGQSGNAYQQEFDSQVKQKQ
ncbi:hypothetical protein PILCRDRAFT_13712 [Piloderma croceum F 1598]|uniref:Uncharacterized protein n=1 Tax=Piloderma croceum (strain F 1598) TaxID=765440 RepID=A0A0C3AN20_PILCF|nr:hypothetical protein PILCRDRAFT_13712 [Piloderma croceum F 1598]